MPKPDPDDPKVWDGFLDLCKLVAPTARSRELQWDAVNWHIVVGLAQQHKVSPAVWRSIDGVADVPNAIKAYFHLLRNRNSQRNSSIMDQLEAVLSRLGDSAINAVLLKGAASLASGLYVDPGERYLSDVDLLVAPERAGECTAALRALGYTDLHPNHGFRWLAPRSHHLPPLLAPSGGFCIELHTSVVERKFERMLPSRDVLRRASTEHWRGRPVLMLHPTDRIVHNIVHSQLHQGLSSMGMVELRQLRELSCLVARYAPMIDWVDVERRFVTAGYQQTISEQAIYCRALMDVRCPIDEGNADTAMDRLHVAIDSSMDRKHSPAAALKNLLGDYAFWFRRNPTLILNLINPFWWPRRIYLIFELIRPGRNRRT